ncbi:MAG: hypothetical protein V3V96_14690, partial [Acidiferrobacterales bacterium]
IASGALTGASIAGGIAQQFMDDDIVGGVTTAANAAQRILQAQDDQKVYGFSPTPQERAALLRQQVKLGMDVGESRRKAMSGGPTVLNQMGDLRIEQAGDAELADIFAAQNIPIQVDHFNETAKTYEGGKPQLLRDLVEVQAQKEVELVGEKEVARILGRRKTDLRNLGKSVDMEPLPSPADIANDDHAIQDIRDAYVAREINSKQAVDQLAKLGALPRVAEAPRRRRKTIQEISEQETTVQRHVDPKSGEELGHSINTIDKDGHVRINNMNWKSDRKTGLSPDFATHIDHHTPSQLQTAFRDAAQQLELERRAGQPAATSEQVLARMEEDFNAVRARFPGPAASLPVPGQGGQPPVFAGRAVQVHKELVGKVALKPITQWNEQELELGLQAVSTLMLDLQRLEQSGIADPRIPKMLQDAIQISSEINARRNR